MIAIVTLYFYVLVSWCFAILQLEFFYLYIDEAIRDVKLKLEKFKLKGRKLNKINENTFELDTI